MSKFIAIDLDTQGIFAIAGTTRGGQTKLEQAVAWDGTDGEPPPQLSTETARRIGEQLRDRLRAAGVGMAPAIVSVPRERVILKELRYPAVAPSEEPAVVRFQAMKELTDAPEELVLDYAPLSNGSPDGERRSMAVAVRKELYAAIQAMCAAAGIKLVGVSPRPYAIASGVTRSLATGTIPRPDNPTDAVAVLSLAPAGGEFTVVHNGEVTFTRSVPGPVASSETMLLTEVRRNLTMYAGANPAHPVQALYIAEAGGRWAARLQPALGIPVHEYDPLGESLPTVPEAFRGRFAGAAGLLAGQSLESLPINFVTPRQPRAEVDPKRNQMLIGALAALLLLGVGGLWGYLKLKAADDELAELQQLKTSKDEEVAALEPDIKRLNAAKQWKGRGVNLLDELFDMTDRFPDTPGMYASAWGYKAIAPDTKTAKQEAQGSLEVKLSAQATDSVNRLLTALDRDNVNPKNKFYIAADKTVVGPTQSDPNAKDYTVTTKVTNRPPDLYNRFPTFSAPGRKNYPPAPGTTTTKEKDAGEGEQAPRPKDKSTIGE